MQRAFHQQATLTLKQTQPLPGHGRGLAEQATNDDAFQEESSMFKWVLSVLANVIGGTLLLSGMFFLPQVIARILG
jgi:hypothetical protein